MLKVNIKTDAARTVFEVEGRLADAWVEVLRNCWEEIATAGRAVTVMICAVSFIDERGKALLAEMHRGGAELVAEGCMNRAIVEEIKKGERQ